MGKRSNFLRKERDFYPTPEAAVIPLLPHLQGTVTFDEPCAGDRDLVRHLEKYGHQCARASDISDKYPVDVFNIRASGAQMFITNPPWDRKILHPLIDHLSSVLPTWLLFDADWAHTKQSTTYMLYCKKIVSVGRVKWIPNSKMTGKDNVAWYLFTKDIVDNTEFFGRTENVKMG